jgi:LysM repeat protein
MFARIALIVLFATFLGWSLMTRTVDGAGRPQVYVVQPGDTLWTIATARYAGDPREGVWKLQRRNHLAGTTLTPGQKLTVPSS